VKLLRLWLLIVLAVLIPARGAMAAAMLCPVGESGVQTELRMQGGTSSHHAIDDAMTAAHSHEDQHHDHGGSSDHHDQGAASDKCNLCSAFCSMTPLLRHVQASLAPLEAAAAVFPDLTARPPTFLSDGQERPPRTI